MAASKIETEDGPCCPICLELFNIPRQLPCTHSFCEKCLQSHIITEAAKHENLRYVNCPVCRKSASLSVKDKPTSEWATLFPVNTVLQSLFPAKSKVDFLCDACNTEGTAVLAEGFCVVCKEAMCGDCLKVHRKQKISKDHATLSVEALACNPENVMKLAEGFTCSEHHGEDIKYYCKDHNVAGCGTCFYESHKMCSRVVDLKKDLPALLHDSKPDEIIADMKEIEINLKKFMEINDSSVNSIETQINRMTDQIREVRKKITSVLDELENQMKTEGSRIYKEEIIKKQDKNHQCLSLLYAVRNSHYLLETVHKYGSNLQKFFMMESMRSQFCFYHDLVRENYENTETVTVHVDFSSLISSILSVSSYELGKVVTTTSSSSLPLACLQRPSKDCQVDRVDVIDLKVPTGKTPCYSDVSFLPGDRLMLADFANKQCILLSSSYQFIRSHTLTCRPWNICVLDDQEVAVSLYNQNEIQILSVIGDIIRPVRMITTKYNCHGIAAAGKGEMVVNGYCGDNKSQWSLINTRGDVKFTHQYNSSESNNENYVALNNKKTRVYVRTILHSHQYDSKYDDYQNYIAQNNTKTRVYVTTKMRALLCFDLDGREQFSYSPDNLREPRGIAVDRYDNIYVVGLSSNNMHQLSPDGCVLKVISSELPKSPYAICIHKSRDILIIMNYSTRTNLHIYQLT